MQAIPVILYKFKLLLATPNIIPIRVISPIMLEKEVTKSCNLVNNKDAKISEIVPDILNNLSHI